MRVVTALRLVSLGPLVPECASAGDALTDDRAMALALIAAVNGLRAHGRDLREAVLQGAGTRLKPVLMTALVAAFGFIPMAPSHGAGAEVQRPLATVVIGGIITSTLLTLVVLPTVHELVEERVARRAAATAPPAGVD